MSFKPLLPAGLFAMAASSIASAQTATFMWLDQSWYANDLTPDGSIVVGSGPGGGYYWTLEDGYTVIGGLSATAVSDDGSVIFGQIEDPDGSGMGVAAIWTQADGWVSIGYFDVGACGTNVSSSYELSGDGTVGAGLAWINGCEGTGFRWTPQDGMVGLDLLGNGDCRASVVSGDGQLIGGFADGVVVDRTPAIWYADGTGELLDPAGDVAGEVRGISDDGATLLGGWNYDAFYWTKGEGVVTFDTLFSTWAAAPLDITDDGTIVGFDYQGGTRRAWIKLPGEDTDMLTNYLNDLGAEDVPVVLEVAQAISTDGRVIIGHNAFSNGWIVYLSPKCEGDLNGDGFVGADDLAQVLGAWGPCAGCPTDLTGDDVVNAADLAVLLGSWGPCPD